MPLVADRAVWDAVDPATRGRLLAAADAELGRPAPVLRASDWARTFRDGVRTAYEDAARALRERAALLALAAVLADEDAPPAAPPGRAPYLDALGDALVALAEAGTWCWAPHDRFAAARGELLPDPDRPFLDLGAAETASLVAWADHVLGERLERRLPGLRRRLRREVRLRVLEPFTGTRDWHWIGLDGDAHNWNPWIHGSVLACALLLVDDAAERARLAGLVAEGLDRYLAVLPADGSIDEGIGYWWQGAGRLLEALDLLAEAGGPAFDARRLPVLAELARYPHRVHLGGEWYVNTGDAAARMSAAQPWQVLHRWGRFLGDDAVRAHAAARGREGATAAHHTQGLGRALAALADAVWRKESTGQRPAPYLGTPPTADPSPAPDPTPDPDPTPVPAPAPDRDPAAAPPAPWLDRHVWLPGAQVLVAREEAGRERGLALAVKGGHNGERHNHLDVGSYWVALDGRPMVVDLGQPTYTAGSFGPDRYDAWPLRSQWHNVPEPGDGQRPGAAHAARDVAVDLGPAGARWSADLAAAYPPGLVGSWSRTVRLVRATGGRPAYVVVEDVPGGLADTGTDAGAGTDADPYSGADAGREIVLRHVLAGELAEASLPDGHAVLTAEGGRALRVSWDPRLLAARTERRALDDPLLRASWGESVVRLTLALRPRARRSPVPPLRVCLERAPA